MANGLIGLGRLALAGGLTLAALAVPVAAALGGQHGITSATGRCLAWFGSRDDGQCISYSNGSPTYIGTPSWGVFGPGYGNNIPGMTTGPLLPGQTINAPVGGH